MKLAAALDIVLDAAAHWAPSRGSDTEAAIEQVKTWKAQNFFTRRDTIIGQSDLLLFISAALRHEHQSAPHACRRMGERIATALPEEDAAKFRADCGFILVGGK